MHSKKEDLPTPFEIPVVKFGMQDGQGNMVIAYSEMPADPVDSLFEGLLNNCCHSPHWGFIFKGQITIQYNNGEKEVIKAGDVYHIPAGHIATIDEDIAMLEFSPEKEYTEVIEHIRKKMQAMA